MAEVQDWRTVYDFWFPLGLETADLETHTRMFRWWFGGGANTETGRFAPVVEAAASHRLDDWLAEPRAHLSLILVLDQFPRSLFAGTPQAYTYDPEALRLAEVGLANGHYDALLTPWEKTFFFLPLGHAEGPNHRERLERVVVMAQAILHEAPEHLKPLYQHSVNQARGHLEVIARFGRFLHRNSILGRASTPEEVAYVEKGDFVHLRAPPVHSTIRSQT